MTHPNVGAEVCLTNDAKLSHSPDAIRQRRSRARRMFEKSGKAVLYVVCRECHAPIKPSFLRGFCPGGKCRKEFFTKVQVTTVVPVTANERRLIDSLLH
jgi:hypothetical protein